MSSDVTIVVILAVGTLVLNKDLIIAEWFKTHEGKDANS